MPALKTRGLEGRIKQNLPGIKSAVTSQHQKQITLPAVETMATKKGTLRKREGHKMHGAGGRGERGHQPLPPLSLLSLLCRSPQTCELEAEQSRGLGVAAEARGGGEGGGAGSPWGWGRLTACLPGGPASSRADPGLCLGCHRGPGRQTHLARRPPCLGPSAASAAAGLRGHGPWPPPPP